MPLRSKLIIFGVATLLLFLGLTAGSYLSLKEASREAEQARGELAKLSLALSLEQVSTSIVSMPNPVDVEQARRDLASLTKEPWEPATRAMVTRLQKIAANADLDTTPGLREELAGGAKHLKRVILGHVERDLKAAEEPTERRAIRLLIAAGLAAVGGAATFAWLYARLVRERRALEDRLHRSEKLAALGTLAAGIAHELNNPLATISISAEALSDRLSEKEEEETKFCVAIQEEAERCQAIIADLSDLARGGSLDREPVDPEELSREALRIVRRHASASGPTVDLDLPPGLPLISADRGKLLQVLVNLLQNGIEASRPDGRVRLSAKTSDSRLVIEVTDEGRGIPAHLLGRIFDPFYTDKERGVGLGLTLCHRIAELHGGDLIAKSPGPDRGATFTLILPTQTKEAPRG